MASWSIIQGKCDFCSSDTTICTSYKSKICFGCVAKIYRGEYIPWLDSEIERVEALVTSGGASEFVITYLGFLKQARVN